MSDVMRKLSARELSNQSRRTLRNTRQDALIEIVTDLLEAEVVATEEEIDHRLARLFMRHSGAEVDLAMTIAGDNLVKARLLGELVAASHENRMERATRRVGRL